jgi:hypothetical protein
MYGKRYQWLIVAAYDPTWWRVPDTNCSLEDIETALQGALLMDVLPLSTGDEVTISGRVRLNLACFFFLFHFMPVIQIIIKYKWTAMHWKAV